MAAPANAEAVSVTAAPATASHRGDVDTAAASERGDADSVLPVAVSTAALPQRSKRGGRRKPRASLVPTTAAPDIATRASERGARVRVRRPTPLYAYCQSSTLAHGLMHEMSNLRARVAFAAEKRGELVVLPVPLLQSHNFNRVSYLSPADKLFNYTGFTDDASLVALWQARGNTARCPFRCSPQYRRGSFKLRSGAFISRCVRQLSVRRLSAEGGVGPWERREVTVWQSVSPFALIREDLDPLVPPTRTAEIKCAVHGSIQATARAIAAARLGAHYAALHVRAGDTIGAARASLTQDNIARVFGTDARPLYVMSNARADDLRPLFSRLSQSVLFWDDIRELRELVETERNNYKLFLVESEILRGAERRVTTFLPNANAAERERSSDAFWHDSLSTSVVRRDLTGNLCS